MLAEVLCGGHVGEAVRVVLDIADAHRSRLVEGWSSAPGRERLADHAERKIKRPVAVDRVHTPTGSAVGRPLDGRSLPVLSWTSSPARCTVARRIGSFVAATAA